MPYKDKEKRRAAQKKYQKKHYNANKQYYKDKAKVKKQETIEWYFELKKTLSCVKCGENHPSCLDFHHKDSKNKRSIVSKLTNSGKKRILEEISKCEVLCANCHRKEHFYKNYSD